MAFDAADAKTAADIVGDQFASTKNAASLMPAYAHLLRLDPWLVRRADLTPLGLDLVVYLLMIAAAPGLLMFPVHYRGTVRHRMGKPTPPLFERIGLRHGRIVRLADLARVPARGQACSCVRRCAARTNAAFVIRLGYAADFGQFPTRGKHAARSIQSEGRCR